MKEKISKKPTLASKNTFSSVDSGLSKGSSSDAFVPKVKIILKRNVFAVNFWQVIKSISKIT